MVQRLFQSIVDTTSSLGSLEIILGIDDDDTESQQITHNLLNIKKIVVPKGMAMGALNRACFDASSGRYVMLINDDVILRTKNWDKIIASVFAQYKDDVALIHVNDLMFREQLCTFPMLSRKACLEIGICPAEYRRYRIDDHIYDIYNMLAHLGHKRIVYLSDVVFEHDNYNHNHKDFSVHNFRSKDNKVYVPDEKIIENDARIFDDGKNVEERKQNALKLSRLIDKSKHDNQQLVYNDLLSKIHDTYSYRKSDFVKKIESVQENMQKSTVTVAVATSDIRKKYARKCLSLLKKHTSNYDLIILDNNNSKDFNHPREMNKVLQVVKTDFLVLMDDDVFVREGWLEGLLKSVDNDTGIVTPLHRNCAIPYAGVYLTGNGLGTHAHLLDTPIKPREIQCICSAMVLIDMKKCGDIRFNTDYEKYYLDIDYSLKVWESGYKVVCTPFSVVTHLGGATMPYSSEESLSLNNRDAGIFIEIWAKSGRLEKIEKDIWSQFSFLKLLMDIPKSIELLFKNADNMELGEFKTEVEGLLKNEYCGSLRLFRDLCLEALHNYILLCNSRMDFIRAKYCEEEFNKLYMGSSQYTLFLIGKRFLSKPIVLIKSNRRTLWLARFALNVLRKICYQYLRIPGYVRKVTDGPVIKLVNCVRQIKRLQ